MEVGIGPGEGAELQRRPSEVIFNRLIIERSMLSAVVMGLLVALLYQGILDAGTALDEARGAGLRAVRSVLRSSRLTTYW